MAEVWEGFDSVLGRAVAVKLLHHYLGDDDLLVQRFRAEAVAAARLQHPSIVSIYDTISEGETEAIVMELIRGRTLRGFLDDRKVMDPSDAVDIGADVADALHAAHCGGVVHRDIKPANILLCDDDRVMVTDFGIAKVRDDTDLTQTGIMLGSVKYLSPEQVESEPVDGRSDIYALGIVLYEALTGTPPFTGDTAASMALARLHVVPPSPRQVLPSVPAALDQVVMRCLARDPADRYTTAAELRAALLGTRVSRLDGHRDRDRTTSIDRTEFGVLPGTAARVEGSGEGTQGTATQGTGTQGSGQGQGPDLGIGEPIPPSRRQRRADRAGLPRRRRRVLVPVLVATLVLAALGVAGALVLQTNGGQDMLGDLSQNTGIEIPGAAKLDPLKLVEARTFDPPPGDGQENDANVAKVIDGDAKTAWSTEGYEGVTAERPLGGRKTGVGVWVKLERSAPIRKVKVTTSATGWAGEIRVAQTPGKTLAEWGEPVAAITDAQGAVEFDTGGSKGQYVLLWITALGSGSGTAGANRTNLSISEIAVLGG